jgi:hypothetical protein
VELVDLAGLAEADDAILVMGARDDSLTNLCRAMAERLDRRK